MPRPRESNTSFAVFDALNGPHYWNGGVNSTPVCNKCHASSNKCLTSSNKKLLESNLNLN